MQFDDALQVLLSGDATLWMQLIGVNRYQHPGLPNLNYAVPDCREFANALHEATTAFPSRQFFIHHDQSNQASLADAFVVSTPPNLSHVQQSLQHLVDAPKPQDTLVFYFSGHGMLEDDTGKLYLCFPETDIHRLAETAFSIQDLLYHLKTSRAGRQVVILDACHSGGVISEQNFGSKGVLAAPRSSVEPEPMPPTPDFLPRLQEALEQDAVHRRRQDVCYFLSCEADQLSWELAGNIGHGAFTYCLMQGIRSARVADSQGRIEVNRLSDYVKSETYKIVQQQKNRPQNPFWMRRGSRDIVIGFRDPQALSQDQVPDMTPRQRRERYEEMLNRYLRQQYPTLNPESRQALDTLARQFRLPPAVVQGLETEVFDFFHQSVEQYQREANHQLHQIGQVNFPQLQAELEIHNLGLDAVVLQRIEDEVSQQFQSHAQRYQVMFLEALRQSGSSFSATTNRRLQQLQSELSLGDAVVDHIVQQVTARFEQDCSRFHQLLSIRLHQYGDLDLQHLRRSQQELSLSDAVVQPIQTEVEQQFQNHCTELRQQVSEQLRQMGRLDRPSLQTRQHALMLGEPVVKEIVQEEERQFAADCVAYRQAIAHLLRSTGQPDPPQQQRLQQQFNLSAAIAQPLTTEESTAFETDCQTLRRAIAETLRFNGSLNPELLQQWQTRWQLSDAVTQAIAAHEVTQFESDCLAYRSAIALHLRRHGQLDPELRQQWRSHHQLTKRVTDSLDGLEQEQFRTDLEAYRQRIIDHLRHRGDLPVEFQQQWRREWGFEALVTQSIDTEAIAQFGNIRPVGK